MGVIKGEFAGAERNWNWVRGMRYSLDQMEASLHLAVKSYENVLFASLAMITSVEVVSFYHLLEPEASILRPDRIEKNTAIAALC